MYRSAISFTDPVSQQTWQQNMYAARAVPRNYSGLPPAKADIEFISIPASSTPLPLHPLQEKYPLLQVIHYAMVIDFDLMAEDINGKRGIAFWLGNNGSGFCASVTSEFGRSNVAPLSWEGELSSAQDHWEWRTIDGQHVWTNARQHGFSGTRGEHRGYDWLDGCPEDVSTMYDPEHGVVRQSAAVPKHYGLGTAQQTVPRERLVSTYSIMLYFPRREKLDLVQRLKDFDQLMTLDQARRKFQNQQWRSSPEGSVSRGGTHMMGAESLGPLRSAEVEITHGNKINQHVIMPVMYPGLWQPLPSALIVCWPVTPEQARELNRPLGVTPERAGLW